MTSGHAPSPFPPPHAPPAGGFPPVRRQSRGRGTPANDVSAAVGVPRGGTALPRGARPDCGTVGRPRAAATAPWGLWDARSGTATLPLWTRTDCCVEEPPHEGAAPRGGPEAGQLPSVPPDPPRPPRPGLSRPAPAEFQPRGAARST